MPLAKLHALTRVSLFAALIGAGAFIHVPLGPAHISFQTTAIMLAGFILGPKKAALALAAYLACGFIGLPMFGRGKAGPASFLGPTAGFLVGFPVGAVIASLSIYVTGSRTRRVIAMVFFGFLGTVAILGLGTVGIRLTIITDWHRAFTIGFLTFLPGDLLKLFLAVAVKEAFFAPPARGDAHA